MSTVDRLDIQPPEDAPSEIESPRFDNRECSRRVYGWQDMTTAERQAVQYAEWDRDELSADMVHNILAKAGLTTGNETQ